MPDRAAKIQRQYGDTVRNERKSRGLTQQELAFKSDLSLTYIGEIERGQRMVSLDTILRVAKALGFTAAQFLAKAQL